MKPRIQPTFVTVLALVLAAMIGFSGSAPANGATLHDPVAPGSRNLQPASEVSSVNPPNGAGAFVGGTDRKRSFQLPLLRTDPFKSGFNFNSIVHIANPTEFSTNLTVHFYNADGSENLTRNVSIPSTLATWQSTDLDVAQILGTGFMGSGVVTASPNAIAVSVTFTDGSLETDNFDTYAGIPVPATSAYFPFAINYTSYSTRIWVRNTSSTTNANITYTLWTNGEPQLGPATFTIPPNGMFVCDAASNCTPNLGVSPLNFLGPAQITSDQPIAAIAEVFGGAISSTAVMTIPSTGTSMYVPRFEVNGHPETSWTSNLFVMNTTPKSCTVNCNATFHAVFFNPDGSIASDGTHLGMVDSDPIEPMHDWVVGSLPFSQNTPAPVPDGFSGSVIVTQTSGAFPIVPLVITLQGFVTKQNSLFITDTYSPLTAKPVSGWTYLPNIMKSVGGQTTAFTLMNVDSTRQDYRITYWGHDGNFVNEANLSLNPNIAWYVSQAVDGSLPAGFNGSVQIENLSGGAPPAGVVQVYAGTVSPVSPSGAPSATPFPTPLPTATATRIPGLTPGAYMPIILDQAPDGW